MTSKLYMCPNVKKPNTIETVIPHSGVYSLKYDLKLNAWLGVAMATYLVGLALARHNPEWSAGLRAALALAPLVPVALYIRSWMRFIRGMDELQRRIQVGAWLFALVGTVFLETAVNVLVQTGVPLGGLGHGLGMAEAFLVALFLWAVGTAVACRRFK